MCIFNKLSVGTFYTLLVYSLTCNGSLPAIKETLLRSDRMKAARTQCAMVPSSVHKNFIVHSIVHSIAPVHIPVQQLETPFMFVQINVGKYLIIVSQDVVYP